MKESLSGESSVLFLFVVLSHQKLSLVSVSNVEKHLTELPQPSPHSPTPQQHHSTPITAPAKTDADSDEILLVPLFADQSTLE
jgi:hypothetical protein